MTYNNSNQRKTKQDDVNSNRRSFITQAITGGILSIVAPTALASSLPNDISCKVKASPLEAINKQKDDLSRLQWEIYRKISKDIGEAAQDCADQFAALCEKVKLLKLELIKTRKSDQVERMQAFAELGCSSVTQLQSTATPVPRNAQSVLVSLEVISKEIRQMAQELLPDGETLLSSEATRILREIIALVQESLVIQNRINEERVKSQRASERFFELIQRVQEFLSKAVTELYKSDSTDTPANFLIKASDELKKLRDELKDSSLEAEAEIADLHALLASGISVWVKDAEIVNSISKINKRNSEVSFETVAHRSKPTVLTGFSPDEVYDLLFSLYPAEGYIKAGACITFVLAPIKGWKKLAGSTASTNDVKNAVRNALRRLGIGCTTYQGRVCQPEKFIDALTTIIMR